MRGEVDSNRKVSRKVGRVFDASVEIVCVKEMWLSQRRDEVASGVIISLVYKLALYMNAYNTNGKHGKNGKHNSKTPSDKYNLNAVFIGHHPSSCVCWGLGCTRQHVPLKRLHLFFDARERGMALRSTIARRATFGTNQVCCVMLSRRITFAGFRQLFCNLMTHTCARMTTSVWLFLTSSKH